VDLGSLPPRHGGVGARDDRRPGGGQRLDRPGRRRPDRHQRGRLAAPRLAGAPLPPLRGPRHVRRRDPRQLRRAPLALPHRDVDEASIGIVGGVETAFRDPIGIGSADRIRLFDATGALIDDTLPWDSHAAIDGDFAAATLARCPDGEGAFVLAHATPGASNSCVLPDVVINEIESNGDATDWVEVVNTGATAVDLSGWSLMDSDPVGHAAETTPLPVGTILEPGAYFVFDQPRDFVFGLGGGDTVTVRNATGVTVDEHDYPEHAAGVWARGADGSGDFVDLAVSTKGMRNACVNPVRINEVESDGGSPDDWIELANPTASDLDVSGVVVKDDDDAHAYEIPAGTTIAA